MLMYPIFVMIHVDKRDQWNIVYVISSYIDKKKSAWS